MTGPLMLFDSRLLDAVPVASSTAAGFDVLNLRDMRDYTWWKPLAMPASIVWDSGSAKTFDSLAIVAHNLGSLGCTVEVRKSTDNFVANDVLVDTHTPTDDRPISRVFAQQSSRYGCLRFTGPAAPTLAIAVPGNKLEVPQLLKEGLDPIGRKAVATYNRSMRGRALGKVIQYESWDENLVFENLPWAWLRSTWQPAWEGWLKGEPFLLAWNYDAYPKEVFHCIATGAFTSPHKAGGYADLTVPVTALALDT